VDNLAEFEDESKRVVESVRDTHVASVRRLAASGMAFNVEESRVRYGYWRAGHALGIGVDRPVKFIFEHPDRPSSEGPYPKRESPLPAPDPGEIASAVQEIAFSEPVVFYNNVAHSVIVEEHLGDHVYQRGSDRIAAQAEDEARRIQAELDLVL